MDMAIHLFQSAEPAAFEGQNGTFDWHGLHARCVAAHSARRLLGEQGEAAIGRAGSFNVWGRTVPTSVRLTPDVNPIDLADRKLAVGKDVGIAAMTPLSGRG